MKEFRVVIARVAFVALAVLLVAGCDMLFGSDSKSKGGSTGGEGIQNLPTRFSVNAPASVRGGGTSGSSFSASAVEFDASSFAYQELKNQIEWMEMEQQSVGLEFVIADRMIGTAFQLGTAASGDYNFTVTQGVVDDILAIFRQSPWWDEMGAEIEGMFDEFVGQSFPISFSYTPLSGTYDHKLTTTFSDEGSEDKTELYWNTATTKVSLVFSYDDAEFGSGSGVYTYNDDTKTATAINEYEFDGFSDYTEITLREASDATLRAKNGVFVTFNSRGEFSGNKYRYGTRGYADDEGGKISITSTFSGQSYSSEYTFDATGAETTVAYDFLAGFDFGDMSGATVLGDIGFDDAGFFRVAVTGVTSGEYYVITNTEVAPTIGSFGNVVGDASGIAAGQLEVMLWDTVIASTTLYAYAVTFAGGEATGATLTGSFTKS